MRETNYGKPFKGKIFNDNQNILNPTFNRSSSILSTYWTIELLDLKLIKDNNIELKDLYQNVSQFLNPIFDKNKYTYYKKKQTK